MGEVSVFYSGDKFGKTASIAIRGSKPCFTVRIGDFLNNTQNKGNGVIVTNFVVKKAENISVTPTLGTQLFLYVGGESAWLIDIQGLLLVSCKGQDGFKNVIDWYNSNNVKTAGKAINLTLGSKVYKGYLHKFQIQSEYKFVNCCSFTASFVGVLK